MVVLGLVSVAIAVDGLLAMVRGLRTAAPTIAVATGAGAGVPTAAALFAFAAMLLLPAGTRRRDERLFLIALVCLPLSVVLPMALRWGVGAVLHDRGYQRCQGPTGSRGMPTQYWARPPVPCLVRT